MISQLIITFFGWLALVLVGTNFIGMLLRGLVLVADVEDQISKGSEAFKELAKEAYDAKTEKKVNIVAFTLIIIYLIMLFYFWNMGVVVAAIMIMVGRIPDLLWEIKHGKQKHKNMPAQYLFTLVIIFASLPVFWYGLYRL